MTSYKPINGTAKWFVGLIVAIVLAFTGWMLASQARSDEKQWDQIHVHGGDIADNRAALGALAATLEGVTAHMEKMDERNTSWQLRVDAKLDKLLTERRQ